MNLKIFPVIASMLFCCRAKAQTGTDTIRLKRLYEGTWYNKEANRYLSISFDYGPYPLINDWVGSIDNNSGIDAYNAVINGDTLMLPRSMEEHICPYCELLIKDKKLLYRCKNVFKNDTFIAYNFFIKNE